MTAPDLSRLHTDNAKWLALELPAIKLKKRCCDRAGFQIARRDPICRLRALALPVHKQQQVDENRGLQFRLGGLSLVLPQRSGGQQRHEQAQKVFAK